MIAKGCGHDVLAGGPEITASELHELLDASVRHLEAVSKEHRPKQCFTNATLTLIPWRLHSRASRFRWAEDQHRIIECVWVMIELNVGKIFESKSPLIFLIVIYTRPLYSSS